MNDKEKAAALATLAAAAAEKAAADAETAEAQKLKDAAALVAAAETTLGEEEKAAKAKKEVAERVFAAKAALGTAADKEHLGTKVRVRSKVGDMRNPWTQVWFTGESKMIIRDAWVDAQIKGGKLEVTEE